MASENWKDVLKSQHADLERLEAMDAALNDDAIADDIDKILKRPSSTVYNAKAARDAQSSPQVALHSDALDSDMHHVYNGDAITPRDARSELRRVNNPMAKSPNPDAMEAAPETADRLAKAKLRVLNKQLAEAAESRKKTEDHARDLQRQLKTERDENKNLRSRISSLESELKRNSRRSSDIAAAEGSTEALTQEVFVLKKDLEVAQRLVRQGETSSKTKDGQIKRAAETIAKLKQQLKDSQTDREQSASSEKARLAEAEERVRTLERQRADLVEGFRKQLKLIDILKRQKVHIEAARLLSFTEEEFMKTLDWKI